MNRKSFSRIETKSAPRGEAIAVFATLNVVDHDGDVTLPGAFEVGAEVPVSAYGHTSWTGALPVGKATIREVGDEAVADLQFFMGTAAGRETFEVVKELGDLQEWSYGYDAIEESYGDHGGQRVRFLRKLVTHEISPVLLGAGVGTRTLAGSVKSSASPAAVDLGELRRIRSAVVGPTAVERQELAAIRDRLELCEIRDAVRDATRRWWTEAPAPAPATSAAAWATLAAAASELAVDLPLLRFFGPESPAEAAYRKRWGEPPGPAFSTDIGVRGAWHEPTWTVWIAANLTAADVVATVAHEVAHAAGADEAQAQAFEARYAIAGRNH
jgi:hypothetical protein